MIFRQLFVAIAMFSASPSLAFDLSGIAVGDSLSKADALGTELVAEQLDGPLIIRKYQLPSGNQLSITALREADIVVYVEMNWGGNKSGRLTDVLDFRFGATLLSDIRQALGSNGYVHEEHMAFPMGDQIALFNSYGLAPGGAQAVTFVTLMGADKMAGPEIAVLDTIILADASFLDAYWGEAKLFDPAYLPIELR